ncbi:hypothetical protein TNCV_186811 [Trichonephila clavipes]|nr:hypothetical protein TNCV_186811 [Trichonephila clavipes]
MDLVNMNQGQVSRKSPELASSLLTSTPMGGRLSLDIFNVHWTPSSRRVFSGTRLELMTGQSSRTTRLLWLQIANRIKTRGITTLRPTSEN